MRFRTLLLVFLCVVLLACTKGSSDDDRDESPKTDTPFAPIVFIQGRWSGTLQKTVDTCEGLPDSSVFSFVHEIKRVGNNEIDLTVVDGEDHLLADRTHRGAATGTDSYAADVRVDLGGGCELQSSFSYDGILDGNAAVTRNLSENCDNVVRCRAIFEGSATRE